MSKRTLSESSTGSEGDLETPHSTNGAPYFKIPRYDSSGPLSPTYKGRNPMYYNQENNSADTSRIIETSQIPKHERRESQASTTSTATSRSSMSETDEDFADGQKLSTVSLFLT